MGRVVQARNKPVEPPSKPEAAPFFLPSASGLPTNPAANVVLPGVDVAELESSHLRMQDPRVKNDVDAPDNDEEGWKRDRGGGLQGQIMRQKTPGAISWQISPLLAAFWHGQGSGNYRVAVEWLSSASTVAIEREISSVSSEEPYSMVLHHQ